MRRRESFGLGGAVRWPLAGANGQINLNRQAIRERLAIRHPLKLSTLGSHPFVVVAKALACAWLCRGRDSPAALRTRRPSRLAGPRRELVDLGIGVLIVVGPPATRAALSAAPGIPVVVIDLETNLVKAGFINSSAKPGHNCDGTVLSTRQASSAICRPADVRSRP